MTASMSSKQHDMTARMYLGKLCMTARGTWHQAADPPYELLDVVTYNNNLWIAKKTPEPGIAPDKSSSWIQALRGFRSPYELCEFYYFRHPGLRAGFQPAYGGIVQNAANLYPKAWEYLQTAEGQKLCTTEEQWQAMTRAVWHTCADGTKIGWNGIGGAPFYVVDTKATTLRLPDLRGMYAEAAGFDGLGVGGVHGDAMRNITGSFQFTVGNVANNASGAFFILGKAEGGWGPGGAYNSTHLDVSRIVPTARKIQPRAWGALPCVYLGISDAN